MRCCWGSTWSTSWPRWPRRRCCWSCWPRSRPSWHCAGPARPRTFGSIEMPLGKFAPSESLTLGVELELQLVSLSDFDLINASPDMLDLLARRRFPGNVVPEITESMIEVSTDIHREYSGLVTQLHQIRDALVAAGDTLNVGVC